MQRDNADESSCPAPFMKTMAFEVARIWYLQQRSANFTVSQTLEA